MPTLDAHRAPLARPVVPDDILDAVRDTVARHALLPAEDEPVVVALSGGKDSILLALALRELGRTIVPVTIDMGYEAGWGARLAAMLAAVDLEPRIVEARSLGTATGGSTTLPIAGIGDRFTVLDGFRVPSSNRTPCTYCYGVKALTLDRAARETGARVVAFAHHLTDAQASLAKEALMHIDRHDHGHETFDRDRFVRLVERLRCEAASEAGSTPLLDRIVDLGVAGRVDTDEPPRQPLLSDTPDVDVVRPLVDLDEGRIRRFVTEAGIRTLGSGCGHGATLETETPRELVHHRVLGEMSERAHDRLRHAVSESVFPDGSGRVRARLRRAELLGIGYKPVDRALDKL